ncbi:MAG: molybdenum cofactor guanylyltransferase [Candidatus Hermodarchaeota archaeon]
MSNKRDKSKYLAISILIGGKSSRFGSDKGLYKFLDKPLISYQLDTLRQSNYDIFLVGNSREQVQNYINQIDIKDITGFIIDENNLIPDLKSHSPMIGLYSASKELKDLTYEKAFVIACDTPFINFNILELLIKRSYGYDCCIPQWNNRFVEPLFAIYSIKKLFRKAKENLKKNNLKLSNLLDKGWKINYLSIENEIKPLDSKLLTFFNINTSKDIEKLIKIHRNKT